MSGDNRERFPLISISSNIKSSSGYFTKFTFYKGLLYGVMLVYVISTAIVAAIEPFLNIPCENPGEDLNFANPAYDGTKCRHIRHLILIGLTREECGFGRKLLGSVFLGGLIGWERRQADRPAGIRTMSLVSLGSCLFTITSAFAFLDGPMSWDASRIAAAIPSGVGFLGAGLIFKKEGKGLDGESAPVVSGLTTAASLWLSAAVGIACGGGLYFAASFGVAIVMLLLRFAPRGHDDADHHDDGIEPLENPIDLPGDTRTDDDYSTFKDDPRYSAATYATSERSKLRQGTAPRKRPALATDV